MCTLVMPGQRGVHFHTKCPARLGQAASLGRLIGRMLGLGGVARVYLGVPVAGGRPGSNTGNGS